MQFTVIFAVLAFSMAVEAVPSARTFASSQHSAHSIPAHNHNSHQHIFPGVQQNTANHGPQVHVEEDSSIAVLVCQVVKVPAGSPIPQPAPAVPATPPIAAGSPSILVSSQETLSDLTTRVRTAMDSLVEPLAAALQNASLWLNRTSQQHLHQQHQHVSVQHEHAGHNHQHATHNHHSHQHMHGSQVNQAGAHAHQPPHDGHANQHTHPAHSAQGHQAQQAVPAPAVPMTVVSVPVMIPAVHAGSFPLVNLSAVVPESMNVSSPQFTGPVRTATSLDGTSAATVPGSNIIGRSGDPPTTMSPATPVTRPSRGHSSAAVSRKFSVRQVATPPPIIHVPVCPDFCCRR